MQVHNQKLTIVIVLVCYVIIRPHRSTMYMDAAYCYRPSSMVCRSVGLSVGLSH